MKKKETCKKIHIINRLSTKGKLDIENLGRIRVMMACACATTYLALIGRERNVNLFEGFNPLGGEGVADVLKPFLGEGCSHATQTTRLPQPTHFDVWRVQVVP